MSAGTCNSCGSQCRGRYCQICGPFERNDHLELNADDGDDRAYLDWAGPHRCDICGSHVVTRAALEKDCDEHGVNA